MLSRDWRVKKAERKILPVSEAFPCYKSPHFFMKSTMVHLPQRFPFRATSAEVLTQRCRNPLETGPCPLISLVFPSVFAFRAFNFSLLARMSWYWHGTRQSCLSKVSPCSLLPQGDSIASSARQIFSDCKWTVLCCISWIHSGLYDPKIPHSIWATALHIVHSPSQWD